MTDVCGYTIFSSFSLQTLNLARETAGGRSLEQTRCCRSFWLVAVSLGHIAAALNQLKGA